MTQDTQTKRPDPLSHSDERRVWRSGYRLPDFAPSVHAAPGYTIFLTAVWDGQEQEIPVDPEAVDELITVLQEARELANRDPVHARSSPVLPAKSKEME